MCGLFVGRFVGGVAVGAFSVGVPPYVEDIAEKHLLPALANYYHVLFACGILFGYIIGECTFDFSKTTSLVWHQENRWFKTCMEGHNISSCSHMS